MSLPDQDFIRAALEKLEFFAVIDFFLSETARHADVVLPGSLMEEDEGTTTNVEGRVIHHQKVVDPAGRRAGGLADHLRSRRAARRRRQVRVSLDARDLRGAARASQGGVADYYGITWEKIDEQLGVFWPCPTLDHPGTPRLYEGARFGHPDGKAHLQPVEWRPAAEEPDAEYPIILTTGRVVSPVSLRHADAAHRRRSSSSPRSRAARSIRGSRRSSGSPTATSSRSRAGAARSSFARWS